MTYHVVTKAEQQRIPRFAKRSTKFGTLPTCNTYLFSDWKRRRSTTPKRAPGDDRRAS